MSRNTIPVTLPDGKRTLVRLEESLAHTAMKLGRQLADLGDDERAAFEVLLRTAEMYALEARGKEAEERARKIQVVG